MLAVYNPEFKSWAWQVGARCDVLMPHRQTTPVVIGRNVSGPLPGPDEEVRVVRLADLNPADVDMRCPLIVGSSQTHWYFRRLR